MKSRAAFIAECKVGAQAHISRRCGITFPLDRFGFDTAGGCTTILLHGVNVPTGRFIRAYRNDMVPFSAMPNACCVSAVGPRCRCSPDYS